MDLSFLVLNRPLQIIALLVLAVSCVILAVKGKQLPGALKTVLFVLIGVCVVFFLIVLYGIFFAGGSAH